MAYIKKIIAQDEELIGIARLHWIYVVKGIGWFLALAGAGWLLNSLVGRAVMFMADAANATALPMLLMRLADGAMYFMMFGGALMFFFFTLKVLVTEIGLTSRRIMIKEGLIFVRVKQIDLEEIRGENMDLGWFGRLLGYGYIFLDCRFIGDVRLPAIENPERFIRVLHDRRAKSQDSLSVVLGKGNAAPLDIEVPGNAQSQQQPEVPQPDAPQPAPQPEIQPGQTPGPEVNPPQTPQPEIPSMPVPHSTPPQSPPQQPEVPQQPPAQPTPAPPPSEPPLQPPSSGEDVPGRAQAASQPQSPAPLDPKIVQQVVQQVMPQMAQQVAKELASQGISADRPAPGHEEGEPDHLIESFDEAAIDKHGRKPDNGLAPHAIH